ncbi:protein O-glucosyltransferase 2-like isoform X2 [Symsagittifera roscoffensis]|uniref:protein O-glucosyltransferase 2-like isoform X2 n=1 Tax=Symsagittifera roscoffensis TaxID=84072 RepID=UPI00307B13ED
MYASSPYGVNLVVALNGSEVFTHVYPDGLLAEECPCPHNDPNVWTEAIECPPGDYFGQIQLDFQTFPVINISRLAHEVPERFNRSHSMIHYTVKDNQVKLEDTEFVMNLGDWPGEKRKVDESPLAILTWGGSKDTRDISVPTWDLTKKTYSSLLQESVDVQTTAASSLTEWEQKIEKGFFRGRDSRKERLELVRLAKRYPDKLDAGLTNYFFFRRAGEEEELGKVERVSMNKFHDFKYQINMDGTVAAYRLPILLAGNSVVFKHESNYYEHFYSQLIPWTHYIPFHANLSDLVNKIDWARDNDVTAQKIGKKGREFVMNNLTPNLIYCYYYRVLQTYISRQKGAATVHEGMELVSQPNHDCQCMQADTTKVRSTDKQDTGKNDHVSEKHVKMDL